MLELFFDSSGIVHMEFILEWATVNKHHYKGIFTIYAVQFVISVLSFGAGRTGCCYTTPLHSTLCLSKRNWQNDRSPFWHTLHTYLSHHAIFFSFPTWKKSHVGVNFSWLRRASLHKGSQVGPACKYLSAVFPTAIPTLADLHSSQQRLFWGRMWICVSVCEYLVLLCDKATAHEIIDYNSIHLVVDSRPATLATTEK
jgi:hypothetical protein